MKVSHGFSSLREILSECSLDNRLYVLSILSDTPMSVANVRRSLIEAGREKSFATVKRYLDSLKKIGLVEELDGRYRLTNSGFYLSSCFEEVRENISTIDRWSEVLSGVSISCLPAEFIHGLKVLKKARYIADSFSLITELFAQIQRAEREVFLLAHRPSYPLFELIGKRVMEGVVYRGVSSTEYTQMRQEYAREFIKAQRLSGGELRRFRGRFLMREHPGVRLHAVVVDTAMAGINFPYRDGRPNMETAFVSTHRDFVMWVRGIIEYFWKQGRPIDF
ncbi:MAG: hypothetical protein GXO66_02480 [Euryarchaeota archaeon]|nr:hypothetical protein [Euryarchaeota archaeon]